MMLRLRSIFATSETYSSEVKRLFHGRKLAEVV